jgi:hypothetical protein
VAGHRSPSGRRARPEPVPNRAGAHRAPGGHLRAHAIATAAAVGAVATGTVTALLPGAASPADVAGPSGDDAASAVLDAGPTMLQIGARAFAGTPRETLLPVAYAVADGDDTAATEQRVAAVEKAGRLAAQLAELHAQEQRDQAARARITDLVRRGGLDGWIAQALQIMNLPQDLAPGVKQIILSESGGNPHAVNRWDTNALRGTPSQGLMQTIPSTFRTYVHPEVANRPITDPVANITAGVRYMVDRYGVDTVRAGGRSSAAGSYLGY